MGVWTAIYEVTETEGGEYWKDESDGDKFTIVIQPSGVAAFYEGHGMIMAHAAPTCVQLPSVPLQEPAWAMTVENPNSLYYKMKVSQVKDYPDHWIVTYGETEECDSSFLYEGFEVVAGTLTCLPSSVFLPY